jgi:pyrroloquinoline quinone biosynthesis protein B
LLIQPLEVPHRAEFSDTVAYLVKGRSRTLFYCPDIDGWHGWSRQLASFLEQVDIALLDGTFFAREELPGRDMDEIPHPLVTDTVAELAGTSCQAQFIHLNHSNPLHRDGAERDWLRVCLRI